MKLKKFSYNKIITVLLTMFLLFPAIKISAQKISFGIYADPVISWFSTDTKETTNEGARAGFNFGFTFNKYFASNYSFSTGISILNAGGRIFNADTVTMSFSNFNTIVPKNESVVYHIQYLSIPLGLKFESNQIGYLKFFSDLGLDPKVVIGGKVDIPSEDIKGESAMNELRRFNVAYHITGGIEYSLGGTTSLIFGLGYENNFFDVTNDKNNQPIDRVTQNILKFRLGINF